MSTHHFLCAHHRNHFKQNPKDALKSCINTSVTWRDLVDSGQWKKSLPYIGCAYETACLLFSSPSVAKSTASEWLLHSLSGLTETLTKMGKSYQCRSFFEDTLQLIDENNTIEVHQKAFLFSAVLKMSKETKTISGCDNRAPKTFDLIQHNQQKVVIH